MFELGRYDVVPRVKQQSRTVYLERGVFYYAVLSDEV